LPAHSHNGQIPTKAPLQEPAKSSEHSHDYSQQGRAPSTIGAGIAFGKSEGSFRKWCFPKERAAHFVT
jgi:hypothetical protein